MLAALEWKPAHERKRQSLRAARRERKTISSFSIRAKREQECRSEDSTKSKSCASSQGGNNRDVH